MDSEDSHPKILGRGLEREYLTLTEPLPPWQAEESEEQGVVAERKRKKDLLVSLGFPPRPVPGSVIDLDKVLERCDFQTGKVSPGEA